MTRQAISKKLRFEIFKRDSFTCQYCGSSAPEVLLHADHLKPVPSIYSSARTELAKLLIYGLFRKIRVLAQDGILHWVLKATAKCCETKCAATTTLEVVS